MKIRSIAKANSLYSMRMRGGRFALLQTLESPVRVAVFKEFRRVDDWSDYLTSAEQVLFYCSVIKNVFQNDSMRRCKEGRVGVDLTSPAKRLSSRGIEKIMIWPDTEHEREMFSDGVAFSVEEQSRQDGVWHYEYVPISVSEYEQYKHLELNRLRAYPELNERIALCADFGRNVDPLKEMAFRRPLPFEYVRYMDIIGGRVRLSELGY